MIARRAIGLALAAGLSACESTESIGRDETANFAGPYSISIKNGPTTCSGTDWKEGELYTGVTLAFTQVGDQATARVEGFAAVLIGLGFGSTDYKGTVVGHTANLTLFGNRAMMAGTCAYTNKSVVSAKLQGDYISGTVTYEPDTNTSPDCAPIVCRSIQTFNGTRPPGSGG